MAIKAAATFASLLLPALALTAASATMFTLPAPTGAFPVATATFTIPREAYPHEPAGTYEVQIWYPSISASPRAAYDPGETGWKQVLYRHLIRSHASAGAPAAVDRAPLPIVIYVASWGGRCNENTVLAEELASRGYLVAAIGDVVRDSPSLASLASPLELTSESAFRDTLRAAQANAAYRARRASALLDHLLAPGALAAYGLAGRLDGTRVAIAGYSFGGAVARYAALRDHRFLASVNLDGWFSLLGGLAKPARGIPYLYIGTSEAPPSAEDLGADDPVRRLTAQLDRDDSPAQLRQLEYDGTLVEIAGTQHESFDDVPLYSVSMRLKHRRDPVQAARLMGSYTTAFLDEVLNGRPAPLLDHDSRRDPAVSLQRWRNGRVLVRSTPTAKT